MKKMLFCSLLLLAFCSQTKTISKGVENQVNQRTTKTIEGFVLEIKSGKDGYTAKIIDINLQVFYATISHANLRKTTDYFVPQIGQKLKVSGDFWTLEDQNQITVREIF